MSESGLGESNNQKLALVTECAEEPTTDIGNGRRFRRRHGDMALGGDFKAIKVAHIGWHVFDGKRWKEDQEDSAVRPLAHEAAELIKEEVFVIQPTDEEQMIIDGGTAAALTLGEMSEDEPDTGSDMFATKKRELAKAVAEGEAAQRAVKTRRKQRYKWCMDSSSSGKIVNMLSEAAPYVTRLVDDLNVNRLAVNVANGTIHFIQSMDPDGNPKWIAELRPHDQTELITKIAPVEWYPAESNHRWCDDHPAFGEVPDSYAPHAPVFESFLRATLPEGGDNAAPGVVDFLKRFFGYTLLGLTTEQVLLFFFGAGRNGKSTFMDAMCRTFGDYAVTLAIESFSGDGTRGGGDATPDLARLPGARLVSASEPEAGAKLKEALIKMLTGGEKFPVRRLRKEFFEVDPQFKMVISGNHKPVVTDDSDGTWRRLLLVPWDVQIAKQDVDVTLPMKLRDEAQGIMTWLIEGALDYLNNGLQVPDVVTNASKDYREESNPIEGFVRRACEVSGDPQHDERSRDLFLAYEKWCNMEGQFAYKSHVFQRRFASQSGRAFAASDGTMKSFSKAKSNGHTVYRGIMIRADFRVDVTTKSVARDEDD